MSLNLYTLLSDYKQDKITVYCLMDVTPVFSSFKNHHGYFLLCHMSQFVTDCFEVGFNAANGVFLLTLVTKKPVFHKSLMV